MNISLAVLGVVALTLIAVVVVGARRPRHAEDELAQPQRAPARIEAPSSLNQSPLSVFLRSIETDRETGALNVTAGGRTGSLYFLYGHLFHAACGTQPGVAAVRTGFAWTHASSPR